MEGTQACRVEWSPEKTHWEAALWVKSQMGIHPTEEELKLRRKKCILYGFGKFFINRLGDFTWIKRLEKEEIKLSTGVRYIQWYKILNKSELW